MTCVVGPDVSQKTTAICVIDNASRRGTLAARMRELEQQFEAKASELRSAFLAEITQISGEAD